MAELTRICDGVHTLETHIHLSPGFQLLLRSTLLGLRSGGLALVSPVAIDDALAARIEALGAVEHLIAPNALHHKYLAPAATRWPRAKVHVAEALREKRPDLRFDHVVPAGLPPELEAVTLEGAPALSETVLLHRESRTLVVTDLVFHVTSPRGLLTPWILRFVGAHRRLAQSRALRFMVRDRAAAAASAQRILALDFDRLVMAHGDIVETDARARLEGALAWMLSGARGAEGAPRLPAPGARERASGSRTT